MKVNHAIVANFYVANMTFNAIPEKISHENFLIYSTGIGVTLCMLGIFSFFCCRPLTFSKLFSSKNSLRNTIIVSNGFDPDQDQFCLDPNSLRRLSADVKSRRSAVS